MTKQGSETTQSKKNHMVNLIQNFTQFHQRENLKAYDKSEVGDVVSFYTKEG